MIIVGLGNVGKEYENTHHNAGFLALDSIAKANQIEFRLEKKFQAYICEYIYQNEKHLLVKPTTYMNQSGIAVKLILDYYKKGMDDLFVIYDDLDLQMGTIRIRKSGSAGGHNGMKSIIQCVGSSEFARLRIGIKKEKEVDTISYVLSKFSKKEMDSIVGIMSNMPNIIDNLLNNGVEYIMNHYNGVKNEIF